MAIASTCGALLVLEILLHALGIGYPQIHRLDPVLGWAPRPFVRASAGLVNQAPVAINSAGFRDHERSVAKPEGVYRIAILGDSFVAGSEVNFADLFWQVVQRALSNCPIDGKQVEILGFGVNGYGTAQQLLVLRHQASKFQPDAVVLAFFTGNDVVNNSAELDRHLERPYFLLHNGTLMLDRKNLASSEFESRRRWSDIGQAIYNRVRIVQVLRQLYLTNKARRKYRHLSLSDQLVADLDSDIYRPPETEKWENAWRVTEALIHRMNFELTDMGAQLWLVLINNPAQIYPNPEIRAELAQENGLTDLSYPDRRLTGFSALLGVPVIGLAAPLRAYAERHNVLLHGSAEFAGGHWNGRGHEIAGREIARRLCAAYGTEKPARRKDGDR
ncbi:MAG: SGNH/GDSL hydrolase family protein [Proteobacteria bacterium]|nr:SGNH/GDSL hydrolase family protein [Pseudomonadota bacterium]